MTDGNGSSSMTVAAVALIECSALVFLHVASQRAAYGAAQNARFERFYRRDTAVVRTTGRGVWGPPRDAVEVLRVGGSSREATFGQIARVIATRDGGVLVF